MPLAESVPFITSRAKYNSVTHTQTQTHKCGYGCVYAALQRERKKARDNQIGLEQEGGIAWMSVDLIWYSEASLCDCQHLGANVIIG